MAGETIITVVGNLTADPELRFTANGAAVANFRLATTPRSYDPQAGQWRDGEAMFLQCSVWRQYAENVAESLSKGMRVIVQGRLKSRSYQDRDNQQRTVFEIEVDEVGPALRYATAQVTRVSSGGGGQWQSNQDQNNNRSGGEWQSSSGGSQHRDAVDPWGQDQDRDNPPF